MECRQDRVRQTKLDLGEAVLAIRVALVGKESWNDPTTCGQALGFSCNALVRTVWNLYTQAEWLR